MILLVNFKLIFPEFLLFLLGNRAYVLQEKYGRGGLSVTHNPAPSASGS